MAANNKVRRIFPDTISSLLVEDQGQEIVRMDGLIRKNAGVALNEYVNVRKADVKDAQGIVFAPTDVRPSVDQKFASFVKGRFMDMPFIEGDMTLLSIFGSVVPLIVRVSRQMKGKRRVES